LTHCPLRQMRASLVSRSGGIRASGFAGCTRNLMPVQSGQRSHETDRIGPWMNSIRACRSLSATRALASSPVTPASPTRSWTSASLTNRCCHSGHRVAFRKPDPCQYSRFVFDGLTIEAPFLKYQPTCCRAGNKSPVLWNHRLPRIEGHLLLRIVVEFNGA